MVTTINRRFAREWLQQRSPLPQKKRVATNLLTQARAWASMVWLRGKLPGDITEVRAIQNSIAELCGAFAKVRVLLGGNFKGCLAADYVYFHVTARMQGGRQTATGCRPWDTWLHDRSLLFMSEQQTTNMGDWETSPQLGTPAHNPDEPHPIPLFKGWSKKRQPIVSFIWRDHMDVRDHMDTCMYETIWIPARMRSYRYLHV